MRKTEDDVSFQIKGTALFYTINSNLYWYTTCQNIFTKLQIQMSL